jgi:hypothetical protein
MNVTEPTVIGSFILVIISMILSLIITGILIIITYAVTKTRLRYYINDLYLDEKNIKMV